MHVVAFAARRLSGPVGILGSVRTEVGSGATAAWLQMPRPDAVSRIRLHPLGVHDLHAAVSARLRRSFSRPTIGRIHEVSGGNPFYAIELARTIDERVPGVETSLPRTLAELVRARIGNLDPDVHDALLAASCMASPTVELVVERHDQRRRSSGRTARECREQGHHRDRRQPHSLRASPAGQRRVHRGRARTNAERCIDGSPRSSTNPSCGRGIWRWPRPGVTKSRCGRWTQRRSRRAQRGAPAAAAELMDLAIGLGGTALRSSTPSALHHFDAGDQGARAPCSEDAIERLAPGDLRAEASVPAGGRAGLRRRLLRRCAIAGSGR